MPNGNKSVVMNASTNLADGNSTDSQVQVTMTPDGTAFLTVYTVMLRWPQTIYLRINADEWARMERLA